MTTSSADSDPPVSVLEQPMSSRRRGGISGKSVLSPGLRQPRHDKSRLCPPTSRDRRSASMGAVRPNNLLRPRKDNANEDMGEPSDFQSTRTQSKLNPGPNLGLYPKTKLNLTSNPWLDQNRNTNLSYHHRYNSYTAQFAIYIRTTVHYNSPIVSEKVSNEIKQKVEHNL